MLLGRLSAAKGNAHFVGRTKVKNRLGWIMLPAVSIVLLSGCDLGVSVPQAPLDFSPSLGRSRNGLNVVLYSSGQFHGFSWAPVTGWKAQMGSNHLIGLTGHSEHFDLFCRQRDSDFQALLFEDDRVMEVPLGRRQPMQIATLADNYILTVERSVFDRETKSSLYAYSISNGNRTRLAGGSSLSIVNVTPRRAYISVNDLSANRFVFQELDQSLILKEHAILPSRRWLVAARDLLHGK
jgi:hypothetical protein